MRETQEDIERLQALLDNSIGRAGAFLRRSFQIPEHSLTAQQLIDCWLDVQTVALATVTTRGEPRIAPIGSLLYRGDIYIPTVATAARTRESSAARSTGTPSSLAYIIRMRSSGRGRLPVCVVRKRSVLRRIVLPSPRAAKSTQAA